MFGLPQNVDFTWCYILALSLMVIVLYSHKVQRTGLDFSWRCWLSPESCC